MPRLTIDITASDGRTSTVTFWQSPVVVGSGALSDLVLDFPFVSQCHATIHFDARDVRYVDLGSRNGTIVAAAPAQPNHPTTVAPETDVVLGPLRLRMRASDDPPGEEDTRDDEDGERPYFGQDEQQGAPRGRARRAETTALPTGFAAAQFLVSPEKPSGAPAPTPPRSLTRHLTAVASRLSLPASVESTARPSRGGAANPASLPSHVSPGTEAAYSGLAGLTRRIPTDSAPQPAEPVAPSVDGVQGLRDRLAGLVAALPSDRDRQLLVGLIAVAEHGTEAFVALKNARQALGDELGIRIVQGNDAVSRAESPTELLAYLLGTPDGASGRLRQLTRTTSELLIVHDMAFLAALRDGVTALIEHLDPRGAEFKERRRRFPAFGIREYEAFYQSETEDPWRVIFGRVFAHSYAGGTRAAIPPDEPSEAHPAAKVSAVNDQLRTNEQSFARVTFTSGPMAGREVGLGTVEVTMGRADDNVVVIDHPSVSRYHAVIARQGLGWTIADPGSSNRIVVNGRVVEFTALGDGDRVNLGEVSFRFHSAGRSG